VGFGFSLDLASGRIARCGRLDGFQVFSVVSVLVTSVTYVCQVSLIFHLLFYLAEISFRLAIFAIMSIFFPWIRQL
jgi:hypothetical protein